MAILVDETLRVVVQGITGREGQARTRLMMDYGTRVVAGCTPGKGGQEVLGVPVYDTMAECVEEQGGIDASVIFVPAPLVKDAALEAIAAGAPLVVLVPDRVPIWDVMAISVAAEAAGARYVGPNTLGVLSPGRGVLGMMGGRAEAAREWFRKGLVGVTSRSGGITSSIAYYLSRAGVGLSTIVHVGGDPLVGTPHPDVVAMFQDDPETEAIVMFGEIGGTQEERVADLIERGEVTKPVVAFIGGKAAKEGTRFSHAGAIIEGGRGTHEGKVTRLRDAGARVVDSFGDLPAAAREAALGASGMSHPGGPPTGVSRAGRGHYNRRLPPRFREGCPGRSGARSRDRRPTVGPGVLMSDLSWKTGITRIAPNKVALRGHPIDRLMGEVSFGAALYLALRGELPDRETARLMDAVLVSSIDHGATPPSALAARTVASTGASLSASVAAGVLAINRHHGGAIEGCMRLLIEAEGRRADDDGAPEDTATAVVKESRQARRRLPGFGHRVHTADPRTARLFTLAEEAGVSGAYVAMSRALESSIAAETGKKLPLNVDGAIAAVLCELGFEPEIANGLFILSRVGGLVAHAHEEVTRERPMRRIHPTDHQYDGPPLRESED
jgi:succinyl-CoA synthetase alpha subunit